MKDLLKQLFDRENIGVTLLGIMAFLGITGVPQLAGITGETIILAGIGVLAGSLLTDRIGHWRRIEKVVNELNQRINPSTSLDALLLERDATVPFSELVQAGDEICVSGKGLAGFLNNNGSHIVRAAKSGKKFRFVTHDPDNPHLSYSVSSNHYSAIEPARQEALIRDALESLGQMVEDTPDGSISVRLTSAPMYNGYTIVKSNSGTSKAYVEFFGYKISLGERLTLTLDSRSNAKLFEFHAAQFEAIWNDGFDPLQVPRLEGPKQKIKFEARSKQPKKPEVKKES